MSVSQTSVCRSSRVANVGLKPLTIWPDMLDPPSGMDFLLVNNVQTVQPQQSSCTPSIYYLGDYQYL